MSEDRTERTAVTVIQRPAAVPSNNNKACLVLIHQGELGKGELGKRFPLEPPSVLGLSVAGTVEPRQIAVGRSANCEIVLDEESVSRKHATFFVHNDQRVTLIDHGSTNGTYVNEHMIKAERELKDGDRVKIGRTIFKYLSSMNIEGQYHEEIYKLTTTDGLTGVYNKRYFLESLEREMGRAQRYKRPLALIMVDIDFFKKVNDSYGHLAGDMILKQVAMLISGHVRKEDVFARYGGEEFGLVLPEVTQEGAVVLAEKLRALIAQSKHEWDGKYLQVTISQGVSGLPEEVITPEAFIQRADECLYKAKHNGRNRVETPES